MKRTRVLVKRSGAMLAVTALAWAALGVTGVQAQQAPNPKSGQINVSIPLTVKRIYIDLKGQRVYAPQLRDGAASLTYRWDVQEPTPVVEPAAGNCEAGFTPIASVSLPGTRGKLYLKATLSGWTSGPDGQPLRIDQSTPEVTVEAGTTAERVLNICEENV